jgi:peptidyl-tRNA hydrolase
MMPSAQPFQNMKQMIIVNATLKLPSTKLAAQIAQASAGAYIEAAKMDRKIWLKEGRPQVVLKALSEDDLQDLLTKAERRNLPIFRVKDVDGANAGCITCIGIGPVSEVQIEQLTLVLDFYGWAHQYAQNARLSA